MEARTTGIVGITSFALIAVAAVIEPLWEAPGTTAGAAEVTRYVAERSETWTASLFLYSLGMLGFLMFAAGIWGRLRDAAAGGESLPSTVFGLTAVSMVTLVFAGFAPAFVLAYRNWDPLSGQLLYDLSFGLLAMSGVPAVAMFVAYAALARRAGLPRWTVPIAWVAAVAHLVIAGTFFADSGFFSLEGGVIVAIPATMFLWLLATGVALVREPHPAGSPA